ncbi:hypothetical protein SYNPS1DRAFT_30828, partial [Syncephalis pseudoplumigaleata]
MELPLPTEGTFDVIVGDALLATTESSVDRGEGGLVMLKYNKQATTPAHNGTLSCNDKTGDALLSWDSATGTFTLEHQPQTYQFSSVATTTTTATKTAGRHVAGKQGKSHVVEEAKADTAGLLLPTPAPPTITTTMPASERADPSTSGIVCDDFEDDFIEVDPVLPSASSMARDMPATVQQKPSIYAPVTVNASNILPPTNTAPMTTTATTATDVYSSTSSDDEDEDGDDASGTSTDSDSSSTGSSGSSSNGDDSDTTTDSDEEEEEEVPVDHGSTLPAKPLPPIDAGDAGDDG